MQFFKKVSDTFKRSKALKVVCVCVVIVAVIWAFGGVIVNRVASNKLHSALANVPGVKIDFKGLNLSLLGGNLELTGVEVALPDTTGSGLSVEGQIDVIKLEGVDLKGLMKGDARAKLLLIKGPQAQVVLPKQTAKNEKKAQEPKAEPSFLKTVAVSEVRLEKGSVGLKSLKDRTKVSVKGLAFSVRDIDVALEDNRIGYNDSLYKVSLDSLDYIDAQGLSRIQIGHLATADAGPVEGENMHLYNCVDQLQLAERMGKVSVMWYDVKLDTVRTSSINIPRMIKEETINVDNVYVVSSDMVLLQDDRYPPAVPYPTLQEGLNTLKIPMMIKQVDGRIKDFDFIWQTTPVNRGSFPMKNVHLALKSVSNAHNNLLEMGLKAGNKNHSRMDVKVFIRNNKQESTSGYLKVYDLEGSRLDSFIRPLFGATAKVDIHKIEGTFKGDKSKLTEDFCMEYSGLTLHAWNDEDAPFKIVAKGSGVVNFLANLAVPKSNPIREGKEPKKVQVTFERDPMLPYPSYLIQNVTMGMLRTVLPGGSLHKTKSGDKAKTSRKENLQKK
jgi:hypothetical protein